MTIPVMEEHKESVPFAIYEEQYRHLDPQDVCARTLCTYTPAPADAPETDGPDAGGASAGSGTFHVTFLGAACEVAWPEFAVRPDDGSAAGAYLASSKQAQILVLRFLCEGRTLPATGHFLTYREVPWGEVYIRQFTGRCISRLAYSYGSRLEEYARLMELAGAVQLGTSDAGYAYELFPGYEVRFLLWAGDDEFPPSAQIQFSDNFAAAFHAEDLVVAAEVMLGLLKSLRTA